MFDHIGVFVRDFEKSVSFYEACLAPLGIKISQRQPEFSAVIFSRESDFPFLWMGAVPEDGDYHGIPVSREAHRPMHLSFTAPSRESVNEFYRLGLQHGGRDNGAPEECGNGYYAAYLLDPEGNNIEAGIRG